VRIAGAVTPARKRTDIMTLGGGRPRIGGPDMEMLADDKHHRRLEAAAAHRAAIEAVGQGPKEKRPGLLSRLISRIRRG
jgi:hypothetical protein